MTTTGDLAAFTGEVSFDEFSPDTVEELKKRLLDSIGIGINALGAAPIEAVYRSVDLAYGEGPCTLWGRDVGTSPVGAAMHNGALTRYLDFMDSFLAPGETPHPSDNIGALVAAAEYVDASGMELLEAIGIAYELQAELAWNAPVRDRGFDHVTHTVLTATCGVGHLLGLETESMQDAIGIAGTAHNALRVTRTGGINEWKGLASANAIRNATYACVLASEGVDGPRNLFEGQKGWKAVVSGAFEIDPDPSCESVHRVMAKKYVAETYAQSAVEGVIELARAEDIHPDEATSIRLDTFHGAALIIGGGEGDRYDVRTRAQADHSLPYMLAVALIDRELGNDQYANDRIASDDVQALLRTVEVKEDPTLTERFEHGEMPANITIELADGRTYGIEKAAFEGHPNDPMSWDQIEAKFHQTAGTVFDARRRGTIVETVRELETHDVSTLVEALA